MKYEIFYSDGMRTMDKGTDPYELIKKMFAKTPNVREFSVFRASPGFHSTTQEEFLYTWWSKDGNSYWDNRAKQDTSLYKKRYQHKPIEESTNIRKLTVEQLEKITKQVVNELQVEDKSLINYGLQIFSFMLDERTYAFNEFADRIVESYDIRNPQTNEIVTALRRNKGQVSKNKNGAKVDFF